MVGYVPPPMSMCSEYLVLGLRALSEIFLVGPNIVVRGRREEIWETTWKMWRRDKGRKRVGVEESHMSWVLKKEFF